LAQITIQAIALGQQHRACFRDLPHYDRSVSLMPRLFVPLVVLLHSLSGEQTGIYVADSTKLALCHTRRIHRHKVFDGLAARGIHPLRPGPIWTVSGLLTDTSQAAYFTLSKSKAGALISCSFVKSVVNFASLPTLI
jgi:DDE family transposase